MEEKILSTFTTTEKFCQIVLEYLKWCYYQPPISDILTYIRPKTSPRKLLFSLCATVSHTQNENWSRWLLVLYCHQDQNTFNTGNNFWLQLSSSFLCSHCIPFLLVNLILNAYSVPTCALGPFGKDEQRKP